MADSDEQSEALAAVFCAHSTEFRRIASRFVRSRALAEDVVQDAILAVSCHRPSPKRVRLTPHVLATVRNLARNHLRREATERRVLEQLANENPATIPTEANAPAGVELLREELTRLPPRVRCTIGLRLQDLSNPEVAREMGISVKAVERNVTRALEVLRRTLRDGAGRP